MTSQLALGSRRVAVVASSVFGPAQCATYSTLDLPVSPFWPRPVRQQFLKLATQGVDGRTRSVSSIHLRSSPQGGAVVSCIVNPDVCSYTGCTTTESLATAPRTASRAPSRGFPQANLARVSIFLERRLVHACTEDLISPLTARSPCCAGDGIPTQKHAD